MRSLTLLLTVVGLVGSVPGAAWAQGPTFGIKGGLNVSTLRVDPDDPALTIESQRGGVAGATILCGGGWFALQGEVLYSQNGATVRDQTGAVTLDLDYLRVPILLMGRFTSLKTPITPMLYAGPQVSFELRCQVTAQDGSGPVGCNDITILGTLLQTNNVEFGLVFGGGIEAPVGRLVMQLDLRYNMGLTNVNGGTTASQFTVNNRGWSLMLGLGLPFE